MTAPLIILLSLLLVLLLTPFGAAIAWAAGAIVTAFGLSAAVAAICLLTGTVNGR